MQQSPVPYQVAERIVHRGPEAQGGHQPRGGVRGHEGQSPAVRGVGQPQWVEPQVSAQRVRAGIGPEVRCVGLERGEGRAVA